MMARGDNITRAELEDLQKALEAHNIVVNKRTYDKLFNIDNNTSRY